MSIAYAVDPTVLSSLDNWVYRVGCVSRAENDRKTIRKRNVDAILYNHCIFIKNDIVFDENVFVHTGPKSYGTDIKNKQK